MKKIFLFSLSAALVLSSCTKNDGITPTLDSEITFTSSITSVTTKVTETEFEEGDAISVFAADASEYVAENVKYQLVNGIFTSDTPITSSGEEMSFVAIYPYSVDVALEGSFTVNADQSTAESYEASDMLGAMPAYTTETCPNLSFKHLLAGIDINVTSEKAVTSVTINALASIDYLLASGEYFPAGDEVKITPLVVDEDSYTAIIAPQEVAAGTNFLEVVVDGVTSVWTINEAIFLEACYKYVCNVTVTDSGVTFSGEIKPWEDGGEIDVTFGDAADGYTLSQISADNIPDEDTWVITDASAETADFAGFNAAINALASADRSITVEFPNLVSFPDYAIYGAYTSSGTYSFPALYAISAPVATSFGEYAFAMCKSMVSVDAPLATVAGDYAFYDCSALADFTSTGLVELGTYAFYGCKVLSALDISNVETMESYALCGCAALTAPIENSLLTNIPQNAFSSCTLIPAISFPKVVTVETTAFSGCTSLSSVSLPVATTFGDYAFNGCTGLIEIELPEAKEFASSVFRSANYLQSVSLPKLETMGTYSFYFCIALETISLPELTTMGGYSFNYCKVMTSADLPKVTETGDYAFLNAYLLESVNMPEVVTVGASAFRNCWKLASASLPKAESVGKWAFSVCKVIETIELPAVTVINDQAFADCPLLTSMTLGTTNSSAISSINYDALSGSDASAIDLTVGSANSAYVSGTTFTVGSFSETFKSITLSDGGSEAAGYALADISADNVPEGDVWVITDETSTSSSDFTGLKAALSAAGSTSTITLQFPNLTSIPASALEYAYNGINYNIVAVEAPNVITVGSDAFCYCYGLKSVSMPVATTLGDRAFIRCTAFEAVDFPEVTKIGDLAFYECMGATSISLPKLATAGMMCCQYMTSLESVEFPSLATTPYQMLAYCSALKTVSLPALTKSNQYLLAQNTLIESITFSTNSDATLATLGKDMFYAGANSTDVTLTIGAHNSASVSGSTLTVGSVSYTFKEIILQ